MTGRRQETVFLKPGRDTFLGEFCGAQKAVPMHLSC